MRVHVRKRCARMADGAAEGRGEGGATQRSGTGREKGEGDREKFGHLFFFAENVAYAYIYIVYR